MNAINHAATALIINRRWPGVPVVPVLLSVQLVEFIWVVLNLLGIEVTLTAPRVLALNDIQLEHMPYSHSVAATVMMASAVWFIFSRLFGKPHWGAALAAAITSHIILDLATHVHDIALVPCIDTPKFGFGLYDVPQLAFVVETMYGIWCWRVFRGSCGLLIAIVVLNLVSLSFYVPAIAGPEQFFSGQPKFFAACIGGHILLGLLVVGYFARSHWRRA